MQFPSYGYHIRSLGCLLHWKCKEKSLFSWDVISHTILYRRHIQYIGVVSEIVANALRRLHLLSLNLIISCNLSFNFGIENIFFFEDTNWIKNWIAKWVLSEWTVVMEAKRIEKLCVSVCKRSTQKSYLQKRKLITWFFPNYSFLSILFWAKCTIKSSKTFDRIWKRNLSYTLFSYPH